MYRYATQIILSLVCVCNLLAALLLGAPASLSLSLSPRHQTTAAPHTHWPTCRPHPVNSHHRRRPTRVRLREVHHGQKPRRQTRDHCTSIRCSTSITNRAQEDGHGHGHGPRPSGGIMCPGRDSVRGPSAQREMRRAPVPPVRGRLGGRAADGATPRPQKDDHQVEG